MALVEELRGGEALATAIQTLYDPEKEPDLVVVRGYADEALRTKLAVAPEGVPADTLVLPGLEAATKVVKDIWRESGDPAYDPVSGISVDIARHGGIDSHVDPLDDARLPVVAQLSLCLAGKRAISAEQIPGGFRNRKGEIDYEHYKRLAKGYREEMLCRGPRTTAVVEPGDLALWLALPGVAYHGVKHLAPEYTVNAPVTTRLLNWFVSPRPNFE